MPPRPTGRRLLFARLAAARPQPAKGVVRGHGMRALSLDSGLTQLTSISIVMRIVRISHCINCQNTAPRGLARVLRPPLHSLLAHAGANPCPTLECHRHGMASCFEAAARVLTAALRSDDTCDSVRTHFRHLGAHASPRHARGHAPDVADDGGSDRTPSATRSRVTTFARAGPATTGSAGADAAADPGRASHNASARRSLLGAGTPR